MISIIQLIVVIIVIGLLIGTANQYINIPAPYKAIVNILAILLVCCLLLWFVGLFEGPRSFIR